jgi:hypothetical protein
MKIINYRDRVEVMWEDGKVEDLIFPNYVCEAIDEWLTEVEEERGDA